MEYQIDRTSPQGHLAENLLTQAGGDINRAIAIAQSCRDDFGARGIGRDYAAAALILRSAREAAAACAPPSRSCASSSATRSPNLRRPHEHPCI